MRFRAPFYLVPGDLLLLSPLYFVDPATYTQMGVTAVNGGLIPWQQGIETRIGRFQFVLGREIGINLYGLNGFDQTWVEGTTPGSLGTVVNFKSIFFDLPILEYRPYRAFAANQSSSVLFQLFVGYDRPYGVSVAYPAGAPSVDLRPIWSLGLRMVFDWRHYW